MEKKKITEILDMPFINFVEEYTDAHSHSYYHHKIYDLAHYPFDDYKSPNERTVREVLSISEETALSIRSFGKQSLEVIQSAYSKFGLHFGMTKAEIAALENEEQVTCDEDDSSTFSWKDCINDLKQFANNACSCVICTDDGYKITIKVEKVKQ